MRPKCGEIGFCFLFPVQHLSRRIRQQFAGDGWAASFVSTICNSKRQWFRRWFERVATSHRRRDATSDPSKQAKWTAGGNRPYGQHK
ncbi:hypothetical protein Poly21_53160 [Allorhodopirellula heiligendammensis]|uniref:Uncharacterized protein n=1 Tax=Allorhodopirellula heiligendammensis TaxID=2714739 RepID=A0A5C6BD02_9BACT|nr:hypothetical protein Poly21_53160 [Allorhodopirellula heiligendammensis]